MRFIQYLTATTLLLTVSATPAKAAAQEHPAPPSKPPAENDGLKTFSGNWTCEGTAMLGPGKSAKIKATAKVKNELGGFWQSFVYTEQKSKDYPMAVTAIGTGAGNPSRRSSCAPSSNPPAAMSLAPAPAGWATR